MVQMSTALKNTAQAQAAALGHRHAALDDTSSHLLRNVDGVKRAAGGAKAALNRSRRSFWFSLFVLFAVGGVFAGTPRLAMVQKVDGEKGNCGDLC